MTGLLFGFLGGIIAWLATTFLAQPVTSFAAARTEAAHALAFSEDFDRYDPERDAPPPEIAEERKKLLATAGARLVAFEQANQYLRPVLKRSRMFPKRPAENLSCLPSSGHMGWTMRSSMT